VRARKRVVTTPGVRPAGARRTPTVRRAKPAIVPAPRSTTPPMTGSPDARVAAHSTAAGDAAGARREVDLSVDLGRGLVLPNPILVASGTFGYGVEYGEVVDVQRLGGICCKGTTLKPRIGNVTPRVTETPGGMLNSIGLQNPGVDAVVERGAGTIAGLARRTVGVRRAPAGRTPGVVTTRFLALTSPRPSSARPRRRRGPPGRRAAACRSRP
jgi:hypothetical protein